MTDTTATAEAAPDTGPVTEELMSALRDVWNAPPKPHPGNQLWQFAAINRYLREHREELGLDRLWHSVTEGSEHFSLVADRPSRKSPSRYVADLYAVAPGLVLIAHPGAMPYETQTSYNGSFECFNGLLARAINSTGEIVYYVHVFYPFPGRDFEGCCGAWIGGVPRAELPDGAAGRVSAQFYCGDSGVEMEYHLGPANWFALTTWLERHLNTSAT